MSPTFIVDCSVTIPWCIDDERSVSTDALLDRLGEETALVPSIWVYEVANVLLMAERRKRITAAQASAFIEILLALPIKICELDRRDMADIVSRGRGLKLSAYDAAYVHLALKSGLPLATRDGDVVLACKALGIPVL